MTTYRIPAVNLAGLEDKISKQARRAKKLGVEAPTLVVLSRELEECERRNSGIKYFREWVNIEVTAPIVKLGGWTFVGRVEPMGDLNLISKNPSYDGEVPERYRTAAMDCDHCGQPRYRTATFLLQHEDGTWKQVGRQCIADFLGHRDAEALAEWAQLEWLQEIPEDWPEDGGFGGSGHEATIAFETFLTGVIFFAERVGYVSGKEAYESPEWQPKTSTANEVYSLMYSAIGEDALIRQYGADRSEIFRDPERQAKAEALLAWGRERFADPKNDYEYNMHVALEYHGVTWKTKGFVASTYSAHRRATEERQEREAKEANALNEYFGEVKKRYELTLKVESIRTFEGDYGLRILVRMRDAEGRLYTWWTSDSVLYDPEDLVDQTWHLKATVKGHEEYRGWKQTVLTRAKLLEEVTQNVALV